MYKYLERGTIDMCRTNSKPKATPKPSLKAIFSNWKRSPTPFWEKLKMATRNNLIKLKTRKNCCGHYGEVGCWV